MFWGRVNKKVLITNLWIRKHEEYWRMGNARNFTANKQTRGVLGQTSVGMHWVWGESDAKGFDGKQTHSLISYPKAHCLSELGEFWGRVNKAFRGNQQKEYWRRGNAGSFTANTRSFKANKKGNAMSWGELNVKGFGTNSFKSGETQEVLQ